MQNNQNLSSQVENINETSLHYTTYLFNKFSIQEHEYEIFDEKTLNDENLEYYNYIPQNKNYILVKSDNCVYKLLKVNADKGYIYSDVKYNLIDEFKYIQLDNDKLQGDIVKEYLITLIENCKIDKVTKLLESGLVKDVNYLNNEGTTPLIASLSTNGNNKITSLLIDEYNADINMKNISCYPPINYALWRYNDEMITKLLNDNRFKLNIADKFDNTILHIGVNQHISVNIIKLILEKYPKLLNTPNKNGETPLMKAVSNSFDNIVKLLLSYEDIDVNSQYSNGNTALFKAKTSKILKLLLNHSDIDVNITNSDGDTYLHYFASQFYYTKSEKLVDQIDIKPIEDINLKNNNGFTILDIAGIIKNKPLIEKILEFDNIDVNIQDNNGRTPLMNICIGGSYDYNSMNIIQHMILYPSIDLHIKDNDGRQVIDYVQNPTLKKFVKNVMSDEISTNNNN